MGSFSVSKLLAAVLLAGCLALIVSNVLLARRLSQLKQLDDFLNAANKLELGGVVPPLVGTYLVKLQGKTETRVAAPTAVEMDLRPRGAMSFFASASNTQDEGRPPVL